jgi:hypothetical protein
MLLVSPAQPTADVSCGEAALYTACEIAEIDCSLSDVLEAVRRQPDDRRSLEALRGAAFALGGYPALVRLPRSRLKAVPLGAIVHLDDARDDLGGHFSVYLGRTPQERVILGDAPLPPYTLPEDEFARRWSGYVMAVFKDEKQSKAFMQDVLAFRARHITTALLTGLALLLAALLVWWRRRQRHPSIATGSLLCMLAAASGGCDYGSPSQSALQIAQCQLDLGLVPPAGTSVEIPLVNNSDTAISIKNVRASCGCTEVDVPDCVLAQSAALLRVDVRGSTQPMERNSTLLVETASSRHLVKMHYATGDLPQLSPRVVRFACDPEAGIEDVISLWVYCHQPQELVTLETKCEGPSRPRVAVEPRRDYSIESPTRVRLLEAGLRRLELSLANVSGDEIQIPLRVTQGSAVSDLSLKLAPVESALSIRPQEVVIALDTERQRVPNMRRVLLVTSTFDGALSVSELPAFLAAKKQKLDKAFWKVEVRAKGEVPLPNARYTMLMECRSAEQSVAAEATIRFVRPD